MAQLQRMLLVFLAAAAVMSSTSSSSGEQGETVRWPGQSAYKEKADSLPISADDALALLKSKATTHPHRYFYKRALLLVGDCYFFPFILSKTELRLEGYYVSGTTGRIEFRKSSLTIDKNQPRLPPEAFSEIDVVN